MRLGRRGSIDWQGELARRRPMRSCRATRRPSTRSVNLRAARAQGPRRGPASGMKIALVRNMKFARPRRMPRAPGPLAPITFRVAAEGCAEGRRSGRTGSLCPRNRRERTSHARTWRLFAMCLTGPRRATTAAGNALPEAALMAHEAGEIRRHHRLRRRNDRAVDVHARVGRTAVSTGCNSTWRRLYRQPRVCHIGGAIVSPAKIRAFQSRSGLAA